MMKSLKIFHFIGLAVFFGSIPAHILLGIMADQYAGTEAFASIYRIKYMNTLFLTTPGLVLMLVTGITMMLKGRMTPNQVRWMALKLPLVTLIALNGFFILTPAGKEIAEIAEASLKLQGAGLQATGLPDAFHTVKTKEDIFGTLNLIMILIVVSTSVIKPRLRKKAL